MLFVIKLRNVGWVGHVAHMEKKTFKGRDPHLGHLGVHWMIMFKKYGMGMRAGFN
jgi:hypothetical protein